jgi:hypothetical protein
VPGRKWIFGGQLWKLNGRQGAKDYWAMLFSDVLVLTQVNRDRVIFVMEEPIMLSQVSDVIFSKKKKCEHHILPLALPSFFFLSHNCIYSC